MTDDLVAPPFTGSLDAKVPAENVVLSHFMAEVGRWVVASEASDGAIFIGTGNTEVLARRAAGLRTLAHLQSRAEGEIEGRTHLDVETARAELTHELAALARMVETTNLPMPEGVDKRLVLVELRASSDALKAGAKRGVIARLAAPVLTFIALAFVEGVIGAYAQRCLDALEQVLAAH